MFCCYDCTWLMTVTVGCSAFERADCFVTAVPSIAANERGHSYKEALPVR
jgi:hypothetical protein